MGKADVNDNNQKQQEQAKNLFRFCSVDINDYVFPHHCFMTGEYCSKQLSVQRERERLHRNGEINAFVIMSFTDMTDVVYKWRLRSYIESLTDYLYFKSDSAKTSEYFIQEFFHEYQGKKVSWDKVLSQENENEKDFEDTERANFKRYINKLNLKKGYDRSEYHGMSCLYCYASDDAHRDILYEELHNNTYYPELKVKKINVIRADSNPSSNFVICNRVCQQMQIADLVVVDVSDENTNVFYEMGMAVAMGKMILPIREPVQGLL